MQGLKIVWPLGSVSMSFTMETLSRTFVGRAASRVILDVDAVRIRPYYLLP